METLFTNVNGDIMVDLRTVLLAYVRPGVLDSKSIHEQIISTKAS